MNGITEVELIARQHIAERALDGPRLPRPPRHHHRRRVASTLRRVADRLDG
jgi:hypothetical protein